MAFKIGEKMNPLIKEELFSLETYSEKREEFKAQVLSEKKNRRVQIGEHITLLFENKNTIQYQIQEMLRIEKIFEADGIKEELDAYNPMIPTGTNLKATMLIEYEDVSERKIRLTQLKGVETQIWLKAGSSNKVFPIADEDLERENETKTSAVHFLRFEFNADQIKEFKSGGSVMVGSDHENYQTPDAILPQETRLALAKDFE